MTMTTPRYVWARLRNTRRDREQWPWRPAMLCDGKLYVIGDEHDRPIARYEIGDDIPVPGQATP